MHSEWHASEAYYENLLFSKNSAQFEVINASNRSMLHCWHITSFRCIFNLACAIQFCITSEINMQIEKKKIIANLSDQKNSQEGDATHFLLLYFSSCKW